ncbi:MAG: hypothetical protein M1816_002994 [Peltula sp. TS41687]|nr:MAG: hypothetical protein M1816_002994 [Peltula sp. TS41687]
MRSEWAPPTSYAFRVAPTLPLPSYIVSASEYISGQEQQLGLLEVLLNNDAEQGDNGDEITYSVRRTNRYQTGYDMIVYSGAGDGGDGVQGETSNNVLATVRFHSDMIEVSYKTAKDGTPLERTEVVIDEGDPSGRYKLLSVII